MGLHFFPRRELEVQPHRVGEKLQVLGAGQHGVKPLLSLFHTSRRHTRSRQPE